MKLSIYVICLALSWTAGAAPAVYWVPADPSLQQFSMFEISAHVKRDSERTKIEYTLPLELTGVENHIELEGPTLADGQPLVLRGSNGVLECPNQTLSHCKISYESLSFDEARRNELLTRLSSSPQELDSRMRVAAIFQGGEPHGFLSILRSANQP